MASLNFAIQMQWTQFNYPLKNLGAFESKIFSNDERGDSDKEIELQRRSDHEHIEAGWPVSDLCREHRKPSN